MKLGNQAHLLFTPVIPASPVVDLSFDDCRADDVIEPRKVAIEISVAAFEERALFTGPDAAASRFAILGVELVRYVHAFDNTAERRKRLRVVRRRIVSQIDEDLRCSAVRHGEGVSDRSAPARGFPTSLSPSRR